jgi:hypothetical protein
VNRIETRPFYVQEMNVTILQIHLVVASAWMGLIAAELIIERMARGKVIRQFVAKVHKTIDIYIEAPLVALVLITGCILLYRLGAGVSPMLLFKIVLGVVAVVSNVICIYWVLRRARSKDDADFVHFARRIALTTYTIPLGLLALVIGMYGV